MAAPAATARVAIEIHREEGQQRRWEIFASHLGGPSREELQQYLTTREAAQRVANECIFPFNHPYLCLMFRPETALEELVRGLGPIKALRGDVEKVEGIGLERVPHFYQVHLKEDGADLFARAKRVWEAFASCPTLTVLTTPRGLGAMEFRHTLRLDAGGGLAEALRVAAQTRP